MEDEIRSRLDAKRYHEALELLLGLYQDKVFRLACAMLGERARAEEVAQEVFIRIWKGLPGYRAEASLSTWIYSITRNACLTAIRQDNSRRVLSIEEPEVMRAFDARQAPAQPGGGAIDLSLLISQLPEKYRQVVMLFYMEERSYEEVARLLGLPIGTVKTYLHRARKNLAVAITRQSRRKPA